MKCRHCGAENTANYLSCVHCGQRRTVDLSVDAPGVSTSNAPSNATRNAPPNAARVAAPPVGTTASPAVAAPLGRQQGNRFARDATRYLCAAVQTDSVLTERTIRMIVDEEHRAVASSPGIDLATVLKYALAARERQLVRDVVLAVLEIVCVVTLVAGVPAALLLVIVVAWIVVLIESLVTSYGVLAPRLRREKFDPAQAPEPTSVRMQRRISEIAARDRGNVTVFSSYMPFTGYGNEVTSWSFTLDITKPLPGETARPFTIGELHDFTAAKIGKIGLPGVAVEDRLFLSGLDLLHGLDPAMEHAILPDPLDAPVSQVADAVIRRLWDEPQSRARPYLCVRVAGWSGELVLSVFLRFAMSQERDLLFVEAHYTLLTPLQQRYRHVDRLLSQPTVRQVGRLAAGAAPASLGLLLRSGPHILGAAAAPLGRYLKERRDVRAIQSERSFDFGAALCAREAAGDRLYFRYYQQLDKEMYAKMAERRVLDTIGEFLTVHGIDLGELSARQNTILNNGVMVTGNANVQAGSIAAGQNARAGAVNLTRRLTRSDQQHG